MAVIHSTPAYSDQSTDLGADQSSTQNADPSLRSSGTASCCEVDWERFTDATHLASWNNTLAQLGAKARVQCALQNLPETQVLTSSFGAQAAVCLHLLTQERPDLPVVMVDTGYLFPETYAFIDALTERLSLNLQVYRSPLSAAEQEAQFGKRWEQGLEGLDAYNLENKVEPMRRAMDELQVGTWYTGLRRVQSQSRADTPFVQYSGGRFKVAPIADWTDRDVYAYLRAHDLPYHPLWHKGYVSIGDMHSTVPLHEVDSEEQTRFFGLKRECGLHDSVL